MRKCRWAVATVAALVLCVSVLATGTASASTTTTEAMVRGKLLSLSNLPAGWTLTNVPATNKGYSGPCAAALSPKPRPGLAEAYVAFTDRGRSPLLGEKVVFGKAVTNRYNYVNAVLKSCKYLTFALGGIDEKGTVDPLSFPKLGSSSSAYTITVPTTLGVSVGIDIVIVRSGPYALVVEYSTMGTPDSSVLETFVHQALAKVTGVGSTEPSPDEVPPTTVPPFQ